MSIPAHLQAAGVAFWEAVQAEYRIEDAPGLTLLGVAAECVDRLAAAREAIARDGAVVLDRYGKPKVHPAARLELDARNGLLAALRQLALEPSNPAPRRRAGNPGGPRSEAQKQGWA